MAILGADSILCRVCGCIPGLLSHHGLTFAACDLCNVTWLVGEAQERQIAAENTKLPLGERADVDGLTVESLELIEYMDFKPYRPRWRLR